MIKFLARSKNGAQLVGLGLSEANVQNLKAGKPIFLSLEELGIEGIDVTIIYGETEGSIQAYLKEQGLINEQTQEGTQV